MRSLFTKYSRVQIVGQGSTRTYSRKIARLENCFGSDTDQKDNFRRSEPESYSGFPLISAISVCQVGQFESLCYMTTSLSCRTILRT